MIDYEIGEATLNVGYVNIEEDFNSCVVKHKNGKQDIKNTLDNYIKLLNQTINTLTLVNDSIDDDECDQIELVADFESLSLKGNQEIIDRFVGFGIANVKDDDMDFDEDDDEDDDENEDEDSDNILSSDMEESSDTEEELIED